MFKKILFVKAVSPAGNWAEKTAFELSEKYGSELITLEGKSSGEILDFALKTRADCIVMGVPDPREAVAFYQVSLRAPCPVLSIARFCETGFWYFNRIVFGTDFSTAAMAAFHFAYKLADYVGCKLHVFHALELEACGTKAIPGQKQIENQIKAAKTRIAEQYVSQMDNFDNYDIAVREGIPYIEILKFARETRADLIVMGHHHREMGPEKAGFGRTIEQVILRSACPVISMNQRILK